EPLLAGETYELDLSGVPELSSRPPHGQVTASDALDWHFPTADEIQTQLTSWWKPEGTWDVPHGGLYCCGTPAINRVTCLAERERLVPMIHPIADERTSPSVLVRLRWSEPDSIA